MAKIPDFSELTKKLGIGGIVDSVKEGVKSVIGSAGSSTKVVEGDEIMAKFAELLVLVEALSKHHAELDKLVTDIQQKINVLAKDVQSFRAPVRTSKQAESSQQPETVTAEVEKKPKEGKTKAKSAKSEE